MMKYPPDTKDRMFDGKNEHCGWKFIMYVWEKQETGSYAPVEYLDGIVKCEKGVAL